MDGYTHNFVSMWYLLLLLFSHLSLFWLNFPISEFPRAHIKNIRKDLTRFMYVCTGIHIHIEHTQMVDVFPIHILYVMVFE